MEPLKIEATDTTPDVLFDCQKGIMEIKGASFDEDSTEFYQQLIEWLNQYQDNPNAAIILNLHFKYLNSSSSYALYELLKSFLEIQSQGSHLTINWFHTEEDEDIKEAGEEYSELLEIPINIQEV